MAPKRDFCDAVGELLSFPEEQHFVPCLSFPVCNSWAWGGGWEGGFAGLLMQRGINSCSISALIRIQDPGFRIEDSEFRIQNSGFRIQNSGWRTED